MSNSVTAAKFASVTLTGQHQTLDSINKLVARITGMAGCPTCGRIAQLRVDFLSDPPQEIGQLGVSSFTGQGLSQG